MFFCFLVTSISNAQLHDLWDDAWRHGCCKNVKMLQPICCNNASSCFHGFYFKQNDIVPRYGFERFSVDTIMDVNRIYGGAVDNIYGFICDSDKEPDDSLFNLLTERELFRVNMGYIDAFAPGYSLVCDGDIYLFEQQKSVDDSQGESEGMVEQSNNEISFTLEHVTATLDKTNNGDTLFLEIYILNKTQHALLILPSKMLAQFGFTNAVIVDQNKSSTLYLPRILRYCQNASVLVELPDFYWFDNHVLIFAINRIKDNGTMSDDQPDNCFMVKYIAQAPLNFNGAREVTRHISQIEIEEERGIFSVDAQVL